MYHPTSKVGPRQLIQGFIKTAFLALHKYLRERVQISASGHTDADQLGTDFFRFR